MKRPFREHHLLALLDSYGGSTLPLDTLINSYFRSHKSLGSKDRGFIAQTAYGLVRWLALVDHVSNGATSWEERLKTFLSLEPTHYLDDTSIPEHIRFSASKELYDCLVASHGDDLARDICLANNGMAPTTVRVNTLQCGRKDLLGKWQKEGHEVIPCKHAPNGITFLKKILFTAFPEFKAGCFEMQDEGSQIVGEMTQVQPGQHVLDYCAGAGGKTLAFAPFMENKGQIYLHDIRKNALLESKKRLKRAGVQNAQIVLPDSSQLKKLKKKMDWVLVDAPCSGTGTYRRNPDMKWRFSQEMLQRLLGQQRKIFEKALSYLKPGGKIVYATCSLLKEENEDQMNHFLKTYNLELVGEPFSSIPENGGMDGFFAVTMK